MRLAIAALLALLSSLPGPGARAQDVVNVYNWTDYIDPAIITDFERETGIHVRYDVYDSLETLEAKLSAGHSGYDVVVPTSEPTFSRLIQAGALKPLDWSRIPNRAGLDRALMQRVETSDPGNHYGAIYLWGTIGLGILPDKVRAAASNAPMDSWDLLFKPENARRLKGCGITVLDSAIDVIPTVLKYLGRDPDSTDPHDLAAVEKVLIGIRPFIRTFTSGGTINALAGGETCVAMAYSGDVIQAQVRAQEARQGVEVRYVAPRQGAQLWFDMLAVPDDAPDPYAAFAFINYILRPEVMARITNKVHYANAVPASRLWINRAIADDPDVYPPPLEMINFFTVRAVPQAAERVRTRLWARFKAGS
ncbi:MAG: polyamine ABC transporter substrate-binding protein [Acetobacteraceae bacterium]|nr:polyamine ABC transporter substrate-binding protein [Acetobacteraceae bacterium]